MFFSELGSMENINPTWIPTSEYQVIGILQGGGLDQDIAFDTQFLSVQANNLLIEI